MNSLYKNCRLCPRNCGADRTVATGFCKESDKLRIARADLHLWEEPCICTKSGSGAIFFSGCTLRCCFCQNHAISQEGKGYEIDANELADIMLSLQDKGACNINLISGTQFIPHIKEAIDLVRKKLTIPIVYNCGGYESVQSIRSLEGYIDIYLPDLKYYSSEISKKYSSASDYFEVATKAIDEMLRQVGKPTFEGDSLTRGVMVRHLVLPSHRNDSIAIMNYLKHRYASDEILLSIMSQYTPVFKSSLHPEIDRKLTTFEYEKVLDSIEEHGFRWYIQCKSSAKTEYIPHFYDKNNADR